MVRTATGVDCASCGLTTGHHEASGHVRCDDCGQFAETTNDYCAEHGVNVRRLSGYDHCPKCRQQERLRQERQEMHARRADPRMHSTIDAPRF